MTKRRSWYDGWFYAQFIDRQKSRFRKKIIRSIPAEQRVLDIGCGTGGLCLDIAEEAKFVMGVDISAKQIDVANRRKMKLNQENLEFKQGDAKNLTKIIETHFDYTTIILIIHEVSPDERISILREAKKYTKEVLVMDYAETIPFTPWGVSTYLIEFFAGRIHYANFKDYLKNGGIVPLMEETGYKINSSRVDRSGIFRFVSATA
jgi:ubiquinone/menaquinone biosynthesis C-methylase UbiE